MTHSGQVRLQETYQLCGLASFLFITLLLKGRIHTHTVNHARPQGTYYKHIPVCDIIYVMVTFLKIFHKTSYLYSAMTFHNMTCCMLSIYLYVIYSWDKVYNKNQKGFANWCHSRKLSFTPQKQKRIEKCLFFYYKLNIRNILYKHASDRYYYYFIIIFFFPLRCSTKKWCGSNSQSKLFGKPAFSPLNRNK